MSSLFYRFNIRHVDGFSKPCSCMGEEAPWHMLRCLDSEIVHARVELDNIVMGDTYFPKILDFVPELACFLTKIVPMWSIPRIHWGIKPRS